MHYRPALPAHRLIDTVAKQVDSGLVNHSGHVHNIANRVRTVTDRGVIVDAWNSQSSLLILAEQRVFLVGNSVELVSPQRQTLSLLYFGRVVLHAVDLG